MFKLLYLCICLHLCYLLTLSKRMDRPVDMSCFMCICHAVSGCNFNKSCTDEVCGPFHVSKNYWIEAGRPTINRSPPDHPAAFAMCAKGPVCQFYLIEMYMAKFQRDCNGDGTIDCADFMKIHKLGPDRCAEDVPESYQERYDYCQDVIDI